MPQITKPTIRKPWYQTKRVYLPYLVLMAVEILVAVLSPIKYNSFPFLCLGFLIGVIYMTFLKRKAEKFESQLKLNNDQYYQRLIWRELSKKAAGEIRCSQGMLGLHTHGVNEKGLKFVYCPVGKIVSWSAGDYDNKYCAYCHKYYENVT
jgi:hypothetical protein